jgi:broad specificity phosphatase PhoE
MPYLYVVRHGQPDFAGNYDSITTLGFQQSDWLGEHFAARGLRFARVVSGTLIRQVETCDAILNRMPDAPEPHRDARLNEYDHASLLAFFEGDDQKRLRATGDRRGYFIAIRDALYAWSRHEGPLTGAETWSDFGARIEDALEAACEGLERDDAVLVVTSGGVIGRLVAETLGANADAAIQLNLQARNTGVTEIVRGATVSRVAAFNAIPHLDQPERPERLQALTYS